MARTPETGTIFVDTQTALGALRSEAHTVRQAPAELNAFRSYVLNHIHPENGVKQLYGGYRNLVLLHPDGELDIYWRQHESRWDTIIQAVLMEHTASTALGIPGRELIDPAKPIEISPEGFYMSKLRFVPGETRYPWTTLEISSVAQMQKKLHDGLRQITFDPHGNGIDEGDYQLLHGDVGRGNVLFASASADTYGFIDYERTEIGPRELCLARTASLLLVDSKLQHTDQTLYTPTQLTQELMGEFENRVSALVDSYVTDVPLDVNLLVSYIGGYLVLEDYGDLNHVRDMAIAYLNMRYPAVTGRSPFEAAE